MFLKVRNTREDIQGGPEERRPEGPHKVGRGLDSRLGER